jgi:Sulfotransferase family
LALGAKDLMLLNAKVIHCTRNLFDTCFSNFKRQYENKLHFSSSSQDLGKFYNGYLELMDHWKKVLPVGQFIEIPYEDVVGDLETKARELIAFISAEWDSACLEFYNNKRAVNTGSTNQVRQPIYTSSIRMQRHYEKLLQPLLEDLKLAGHIT